MSNLISGSEAFVEALRLEGVQYVIGIVGSAFMDPLDLFPKAGIRFIQVRNEQTASLMAEGYARATGRPGVCIGQNGPGVTNLVTGVASAFLSHTPMVVITPAVLTSSIGTNGFQEVDQMRLLAPVVKWQLQVNRPDRMSEAIRGAFRAAVALRGPVQVDIPRDVYYGTWQEESLRPHEYRTDGRYGGAHPAAVEKAISLIRQSAKPTLLVGQGAIDSGAGDVIGDLADLLSAPVTCVWSHNDAFPGRHPLFAGTIGYQSSQAAMNLVAESDLLIALGTRLNAFGTTPQYGKDFFPQAVPLIHNSIDPLELGALRRTAVGLLGDCQAVTNQLLAGLKGAEFQIDHRARRSELAAAKDAWNRKLYEMSHESGDPIHPRRALWEISQTIRNADKDICVVTDVGNVCATASAYFDFIDKPRRWIASGSLGGIGVGLPTALGVKLANPAQPVVALIGDGAWSMGLQEIMTAVREQLPIVAVVFNNSVYGAERRNQYDFFGERYFFTDLQNPSFAEIAAIMGAHSVRIDNYEIIGEELSKALDAARPSVLEIMLAPDVLSEPYRRDALRPSVRVMDAYRNI